MIPLKNRKVKPSMQIKKELLEQDENTVAPWPAPKSGILKRSNSKSTQQLAGKRTRMNNTSLSQWQHSQNEGGVTGANPTNTTANQDLVEVVSDQEMLLINMLEEKLEELDAETLSRQAKEKQ